MKSFPIISLLLLFPFIVNAQNNTLYSKSDSFQGTNITIKQDSYQYPRTYTLTIEKNNTVITKRDTLFDGTIKDSWITDMDSDNNPEISVFTQSSGSGSYGSLDFSEFTNFSLKSFSLPALPTNLNNQYMGHDEIGLENGQIVRSFPLYNESDANCCPTGGKASVRYSFTGNNITEMGYQITENNNTQNPSQSISLQILSVKGLPKMDALSQTDAWIRVMLGNREVGRTQKMQDSGNPYFNQEIVISGYQNQEITFVVYDMDATKNELVGEASILEPKSGSYPILYQLNNGDITNNGVIEIRVNE